MIDLTSEEKMFIKMAAHNDVIRAVVAKHLVDIRESTAFREGEDSVQLMMRLNTVSAKMIEFCGLFK